MSAGDVRIANDSDAYDRYASAHAEASPFHRRAWGDAVSAACGHRQHHLVALRGDTPVGILPLTEIRSLVFGKSLVSNGFAVEGGPLAEDDAALGALDAAAWGIAERAGVTALEYRSEDPRHDDWAKKRETYAGFRRPLTASSDENLKAIPRKQRAEVRKALKSGMTVETGRDARALALHYHVYSRSVHNLGTPVFPRALFREMIVRFGGDADILTVFSEGQPVASVLSLYHRGTVYPYWGGGTFAARTLKANEYMYWMLMEHAVSRGCTAFDFGRSKLGTGAYAYKKNWGFEPQPLTYEYRLAPGADMPDLNPMSSKFRLMTQVWQRLPLTLANRIGPLVARNLG